MRSQTGCVAARRRSARKNRRRWKSSALTGTSICCATRWKTAWCLRPSGRPAANPICLCRRGACLLLPRKPDSPQPMRRMTAYSRARWPACRQAVIMRFASTRNASSGCWRSRAVRAQRAGGQAGAVMLREVWRGRLSSMHGVKDLGIWRPGNSWLSKPCR